jgi:L-lactate dehydrogenase complex protein LldG
MNRDAILHKVRIALGRNPGAAPDAIPAALLSVPELSPDERVERFRNALEHLGGTAFVVGSPEEARAKVASLLGGRPAVASDEEFLLTCGIGGIAGVRNHIADRAAWREVCASAEAGVTSANAALADTATLVMIASAEQPRLVSLLPPLHIAVVPESLLLTSFDEWLRSNGGALDHSSSVVLITGSSRTADIEQILIRGVHGPREICVIFVRGQ